MKLASKKGKTFADVAKPIQNLIEKLKDKPQSQAVKNSTMLLEKQLDDLFRLQEESKPQALQAPQDMNQMIQNPQEEMMEGMPQQEDQMGMMQPQMRFGGLKTYDGLQPYPSTVIKGNPIMNNNWYNPMGNAVSKYRNNQMVENQQVNDELGNQMAQMNNTYRSSVPNANPVFGQENNSSMMNAQPTYNNNIFQPIATGTGDIVRNQSNPQELRTALDEQTQEQPNDMVTFGRKNSKINYNDPTFVSKEDTAKTATNTNPYNNWSELGALGTGLAGMYKQMNANARVQAPTDMQSVYLGNGIAPPKIDYSEEQNQINADAAADREAVRLGGGSFSTQAGNLGKIRAQQLQGRGKIATQQSRENAANTAAYNDRVANLGAESQKMNLAAAQDNAANRVGFQQWQAAQDNAATANSTQMITNVLNNRTMYKNQLAQAQIMANAHPESVWADAQGNKFYTTPQGQKIPLSPQAEAPVVSATNPTGVNMVPAATPVANAVAPIRKTNSKKQNIISNDGGKTWQVEAKYAEGGSVYRKALQQQINQPTIANTQAMDAEYAKNLQLGNTSFKSSITGLEYKVMPRGEKDLYAANMWKEAHGTAPTKPQVAATKKAIENKPTSSVKAKTVAEIISNANNPVAIGVAPVNNFNTTPPGQLPVINTSMYSEDLRKAGTAVAPQGRKTGPSMIDKFQTWQNQPSTYSPSTAAAPDYSNQNTMQYMNQNNMPTFNAPNEEPTRNQISRIMKNEPAYKPGTYKQQATPLFESVPTDNRNKYNSFNTGSVDEGNQNTMLYMDKNNMPTNFGPPKLSKNTNTKTIKMNERLNQNNVDNTRTNLQANKSPKKQDQNIPMLNQKIGKPTIMNQGSDAYNDIRDYAKANETKTNSNIKIDTKNLPSPTEGAKMVIETATKNAGKAGKFAVPLPARMLVNDLFNKDKDSRVYTEKEWSKRGLKGLKDAVNTAKKDGRAYLNYADFDGIAGTKQSEESLGDKVLTNINSQIGKYSLGHANFKQKGDSTIITDKYNFNDKNNKNYFSNVKGRLKVGDAAYYAPFRAMGTTWGSEEGKGSSSRVAIYNPETNNTKKKKKS